MNTVKFFRNLLLKKIILEVLFTKIVKELLLHCLTGSGTMMTKKQKQK